MNTTQTTIDKVYETLDGSMTVARFIERHGIASLNVLTVHDEEDARAVVAQFADEIKGRRVVEIGSGVGYLALEMARCAKSVVAIESDPAWSWVFTKFLYRQKPPNLTWVFGTAGEINLSADVAVICSRSGLAQMLIEARRMAPVIVLICCEEAVICGRHDPLLDHLANYTKEFADKVFAELEADPAVQAYMEANTKP